MSALKKIDLAYQARDLQSVIMQTLKQKNITSPVLQRLRQNISGKTGLVIHSYDRMHHRHNRS